MLCYAMLCYAMRCDAMRCNAMLCYDQSVSQSWFSCEKDEEMKGTEALAVICSVRLLFECR